MVKCYLQGHSSIARMDPKTAPGMASKTTSLNDLDELVVKCRACPRLVQWREQVAHEKRAAYADQEYWGKPVPGFGPSDAKMLIVGLAPGAHGANRTGRLFTGDQSGDVLFAALHRVGLANQATATGLGDGLTLFDVRMSAPVKCVPPQNKPTTEERHNCSPFLAHEIELLAPTLKVIFVLGGFGWVALLAVLKDAGWIVPSPRPKFGHGTTLNLTHPDGRSLAVVGCFHVSQHNTFTGRLTPQMLDETLTLAKELAGMR